MECILFPSKRRWLWKEPVVLCGNWMSGKQRHSKCSKWPPPSAWIHASSLSPLINRIVQHTFLKFNPCLNKPMPQLVRILVIGMHPHHAPDAIINRVYVTTVGWPHVRTDQLRCLTARLCHKHDVLAHCLAGSQTRLHQCCGSLVAASASATRRGNTARWVLLQSQRRWGWYSRVWILQESAYQVPIRDTDELLKRLVATWAEFQHSVHGGTQHYPQSREKSFTFYKVMRDIFQLWCVRG